MPQEAERNCCSGLHGMIGLLEVCQEESSFMGPKLASLGCGYFVQRSSCVSSFNSIASRPPKLFVSLASKMSVFIQLQRANATLLSLLSLHIPLR